MATKTSLNIFYSDKHETNILDDTATGILKTMIQNYVSFGRIGILIYIVFVFFVFACLFLENCDIPALTNKKILKLNSKCCIYFQLTYEEIGTHKHRAIIERWTLCFRIYLYLKLINDTLGGGILRSKTEFPRVQRAMSGLPLSMAVWPRTNLELVNHLCMFLKTDTPIWSDCKQDLGNLFSNLFFFFFLINS